MRNIFLKNKNIRKEKLKVVRLKFAIGCEKALGDICKVTLLHESMLRTT